jgi:hypothetical protein
MIRLGHITITKKYLMVSLLLAACLSLSFIDKGFSAEPQQGGSMPAKPSTSTTQQLVPPDSTKIQSKIGPDVKTSTDRQGNIILSSDISTTENIASISIKSLNADIKDYQIGFFDGYKDGYKLAKQGGSHNDLFKMKKATNMGIITGFTNIINVGYDKGLSEGYAIGTMVKTTKEKPK